MSEPFVVKHYQCESRPILKGNGFDGLEIGTEREEAEEFVSFINALRAKLHAAEADLRAMKTMDDNQCRSAWIDLRNDLNLNNSESLIDAVTHLRIEGIRLQEEVDRMREALEKIRNHEEYKDGWTFSYDVSRAALEAEP